MKFLADEGVDKPIVIALRKAGFDIDYILESNQVPMMNYTDCASVIVQLHWPKRLLHRHYTGNDWANL